MGLFDFIGNALGSKAQAGPAAGYTHDQGDIDADRQNARGNQLQSRGAIQANDQYGAQDRASQQAALGQLANAASGNAPSAAAQQMQQGTDAALKAQMAGAASARGGGLNQSLAGIGAANSGAQAQQANVANTGVLRAQEMAQARGAYSDAANAARGQSQQYALGQGQLALGSQGQNDQAALGWGGLGNQSHQIAQGGDIANQNAQTQTNMGNAQSNNNMGMGLVSMAAQGAAMSDYRAKQDIHALMGGGGHVHFHLHTDPDAMLSDKRTKVDVEPIDAPPAWWATGHQPVGHPHGAYLPTHNYGPGAAVPVGVAHGLSAPAGAAHLAPGAGVHPNVKMISLDEAMRGDALRAKANARMMELRAEGYLPSTTPNGSAGDWDRADELARPGIVNRGHGADDPGLAQRMTDDASRGGPRATGAYAIDADKPAGWEGRHPFFTDGGPGHWGQNEQGDHDWVRGGGFNQDMRDEYREAMATPGRVVSDEGAKLDIGSLMGAQPSGDVSSMLGGGGDNAAAEGEAIGGLKGTDAGPAKKKEPEGWQKSLGAGGKALADYSKMPTTQFQASQIPSVAPVAISDARAKTVFENLAGRATNMGVLDNSSHPVVQKYIAGNAPSAPRSTGAMERGGSSGADYDYGMSSGVHDAPKRTEVTISDATAKAHIASLLGGPDVGDRAPHWKPATEAMPLTRAQSLLRTEAAATDRPMISDARAKQAIEHISMGTPKYEWPDRDYRSADNHLGDSAARGQMPQRKPLVAISDRNSKRTISAMGGDYAAAMEALGRPMGHVAGASPSDYEAARQALSRPHDRVAQPDAPSGYDDARQALSMPHAPVAQRDVTSDRNAKRGMVDIAHDPTFNNPMTHEMRATHPYSYEYKDGRDDTMGQQGAHRVGIIAQEADADPVGHTMIQHVIAPDGKPRLAINMGAGLSVALASDATLQEELDDVNKRIAMLAGKRGRRG